nr:hypothetical protein [uncultured Treponema sp.]
MPGRQRLVLVYKPVGTGFRKPFEFLYFLTVKFQAFRLVFKTVFVVCATAGIAVKKIAGNSCVEDFFSPEPAVYDFPVAASSATVAKGFPFFLSKILNLLCFPEVCHQMPCAIKIFAMYAT